MNIFFVKQWEDNKHLLKEKLSKNQDINNYSDLVIEIFKTVILVSDKDYWKYYTEYPKESEWNFESITIIDDGNYQGTQLFVIPKNTYQPSINDYIVTYVDYGSCSGCDTLERILSFYGDDDFYTEMQIEDFMTLALHIIQSLKFILE